MRPLARVIVLGLALVGAPALARPFSVDDLLKVESLQGAFLAPKGRWLVIQRAAPYDTAGTYDDDVWESLALSRLEVVDLRSPATRQALVEGEAGEGLNAGPFSPDGRSMAVFRLQGHHWDLGIADLQQRTVRWLALAAEPGYWGRSVQWRSDRELIAIVRADGATSARFDGLWAAQERPAARWAAAASGKRATDTVVGSGRFLRLTPQVPPARLVRIDAASGRADTLASGDFLDLEISSDGRFAAALAEAEPIQPKASDVARVGTAARRRTITLVDLQTTAVSWPCGAMDFATHLLTWGPHRDRLLAYARQIGEDWALGALVSIDATSGFCDPVKAPSLRPAVRYGAEGFPLVRAEWMGDEPIVLAEPRQAEPGQRRDWYRLLPKGALDLTAQLADPPGGLAAVDDGGFAVVGARDAWRLDRNGRIRAWAPGFNRPIGGAGPGEGDRLNVISPRRRAAWLANASQTAKIDGQGVHVISPLPTGAVALARDDQTLLSQTTDEHGVSNLTLFAKGQATRVLEINRAYADIDFAEVQAVAYLGIHGEPLTAWLYRPAHLPPGRKAPLVVLPYPGSVYTAAPKAYAPGSSVLQCNPQVLAGAGYAVLVPSLPRNPDSDEPAAGLADQILAAVDAVAKTGLVDTDRMALWGHSFGGYAVLAAASQTQRFKSVIASAGPTDLISLGGVFTPSARSAPEDGLSINATTGWVETGQAHLGGAPSQDIQRFARNSPALNAERIQTPVLLIHGDQDFVPLSQGEEMFSALYRQDKDAVLVTLWGEGHTATSPANVRKMYSWIFWWLMQTLGPGLKA